MPIKISKVAKDLNIALPTVIDFLQSKGINVDMNPNTRIDDNAYNMLVAQYGNDKVPAKSAERQGKPATAAAPEKNTQKPTDTKEPSGVNGPRVIGHIQLDKHGNPIAPEKPKPAPQEPAPHLRLKQSPNPNRNPSPSLPRSLLPLQNPRLSRNPNPSPLPLPSLSLSPSLNRNPSPSPHRSLPSPKPQSLKL